MAGASRFLAVNRFRRQRYYKKEERCSVPFLSYLFLSDFFIFFSFCVAQSMSMQYFSQRYLTATGGSILVDGDTPICRSSSWSESNHRRKVGSDTPAACANSDLSFDLYFSIGYICYHYTQKKGRYRIISLIECTLWRCPNART